MQHTLVSCITVVNTKVKKLKILNKKNLQEVYRHVIVEHCFNAEDIMLKYVPQKITQYIYLKERGGKWSSKLIAAMGLLLLKAMM